MKAKNDSQKVAGFFLLICCGCNVIAKKIVEKPRVNVEYVTLAQVSVVGATAVFGLRVENPNLFRLKVDTLNYKVEIGRKHLVSGQIDHPVEVSGKSTKVTEILVPFKYDVLFSSLLDMMETKVTQYRFSGEIGSGSLHIPFDETGNFKIE